MDVTRTDVENLIIGFCSYIGLSGKKINVQQAHYISIVLHKTMGLCVTTLFVEEVWNNHIKEDE